MAVADVAKAVGAEDGRVIGGHMVTLHVLRWGLDLLRATQDADLGVRPAVVQTPELTDRLLEMGYARSSGNRFQKAVTITASDAADSEHHTVIDVLVPAYTSRARENRRFGEHLVTTEVPGLATALDRPPVDLMLDIELLDGSRLTTRIRIPDETSALTLKAMARKVRHQDRDALDIWRILEVCNAAGLRDVHFGPDNDAVRDVLESQFGRGGTGVQDVVRADNLSQVEAARRETRIQALKSRILGVESS